MEDRRTGTSNGILEQQECHHHWTIGIAQGPISRGVCTVCGISKEFKNYPSDHMEMVGEYRALIGKEKKDKEVKEESNSKDYALSSTRRE